MFCYLEVEQFTLLYLKFGSCIVTLIVFVSSDLCGLLIMYLSAKTSPSKRTFPAQTGEKEDGHLFI